MNNFNIEFMNSSKCKINGELWCKAEPVAVAVEKKPYFPKPVYDKSYYCIDQNGEMTFFRWRDDVFDNYHYHTLNCWLGRSELEAYIARYGKCLPDRLQLAIRRWKIAKGVEDRFDWKDGDEPKYFIQYDNYPKKWRIYCGHLNRFCGTEYFSIASTAEKCLTVLHEYFDDQLNEWNSVNGGGENND